MFEAEALLNLADGSTVKMVGFKPTISSSLLVHYEVVSNSPLVMADSMTISLIKSGLSLKPIIPEFINNTSQMLLFAAWLEVAAEAEMAIVNKLTFRAQSTKEISRAIHMLSEIVVHYKRGN